MSSNDAADPYADMTPVYGSAELPEVPPNFDLSADVAMPLQSEPERESAPLGPPAAEQTPDPAAEQGVAPGPEAAAPPAADRADEPVPATAWTAESAASVETAMAGVSAQLTDLFRLRARDVDLADRLYAENTRLRTGEFAAAVAPLLTGLLRLNDQMTSLAAGDSNSVAGMLRTQLLQILDTAAGLTPFEPRPGERFDSSRHAGAGRVGTSEPAAEGTVARFIKPGFERADGTVVRVAQVEVYRFESRDQQQNR